MNELLQKKNSLLNHIKSLITEQQNSMDKPEIFDNLIMQENSAIENIKQIDIELSAANYNSTTEEKEQLISLINEIKILKNSVISEFNKLMDAHKQKEKDLNVSKELANKYYQKPPTYPRFFDTILK